VNVNVQRDLDRANNEANRMVKGCCLAWQVNLMIDVFNLGGGQ
jgi:hypothetical protein